MTTCAWTHGDLVTNRCILSPEFKEIRKEWKARKKDEENRAEECQRQAAQVASQSEPQNTDTAQTSSASTYTPGVRPQLPPIGYQPAKAGQGHSQAPPGGIEQYGNQMYLSVWLSKGQDS
jgi:hypothetical protein